MALTNLDQPLFDGAGATKGDLVAYLDAVADRLVPVLADRPLSVIRARPGQAPFMQKNVPKSAPAWLERVSMWAETSQRSVAYALCNDRRSLRWFANQRAVEYHPALVTAARPDRMTHLVLDLDPPEGHPFAAVVAVARAARQVLLDAGLDAAVKTSGAKGLHLFVPLELDPIGMDEAAGALRALAARTAAALPELATTAFLKEDRGDKVFVDPTRVGHGTVVAAYSPRARPGVPVSFPLAWDELDGVRPAELTIHTAVERLAGADRWAELMPSPRRIPAELIEEGRAIPIPRVAAMHEGKRRRRARSQDA